MKKTKLGKDRKNGASTGHPIGTYSRGDKHPYIEGKGFCAYVTTKGKKYEHWVEINKAIEMKERSELRIAVSKRKMERALTPKRRPHNAQMQSGKPVGAFSRGDIHPSNKDLMFRQYLNGKELWSRRGSKFWNSWNSRVIPKKRNNPGKWKCDRMDSVVYERNYNKLYSEWAYETYVKRVPKTEKELKEARRKRRKAYWAKNPAYRAELRRARKNKIKSMWKELSSGEKKQANEIYQIRDMLNAAHGCIAYVVDHIEPIAKGGLHHPMNLQLATYGYNEWKSDKTSVTPDDYAAQA